MASTSASAFSSIASTSATITSSASISQASLTDTIGISSTFRPSICVTTISGTKSSTLRKGCPPATLISPNSIFNLTCSNSNDIRVVPPAGAVLIKPFNSITYKYIKECCDVSAAYAFEDCNVGAFCLGGNRNMLGNISGCIIGSPLSLQEGIDYYQCESSPSQTCDYEGPLVRVNQSQVAPSVPNSGHMNAGNSMTKRAALVGTVLSIVVIGALYL